MLSLKHILGLYGWEIKHTLFNGPITSAGKYSVRCFWRTYRASNSIPSLWTFKFPAAFFTKSGTNIYLIITNSRKYGILLKEINDQLGLPLSVKLKISVVKSILRSLHLINCKPINHCVQARPSASALTELYEVGQIWGSKICSFLSRFPTKWRILDSTIPYQSSWSSGEFELATRTMKCL